MALLFALPIGLRLILLPHHPVPTPQIYDEFAHLLVADTLSHFRLANAVHPLHRFFETFFTLQEPSYSSIYPLGQGLVMALGRAIFATPWAGVLIGTGALCALCYWMLRAWTTPLWALIGGVLAVIEFGPLSEWTNTYWGGSAAACAGCLVLGALPRLRQDSLRRNWRERDAILLGAGFGLHVLTRPYESVFLAASAALFFAPWKAIRWPKVWHRYARGAAGAWPDPAAEQAGDRKLDHAAVSAQPVSVRRAGIAGVSGAASATSPVDAAAGDRIPVADVVSRPGAARRCSPILLRLEYRVRYYRFFFLPALYLALPFFFAALREWRFQWVAVHACAVRPRRELLPVLLSALHRGADLFVRAGERDRAAAVVPLADFDGARSRVDDSSAMRSTFRAVVRSASVRSRRRCFRTKPGT